MLNLSLIAAGFVIAPFMPRFGLPPIVGMAIGATLGGLGQLLIQVPALHGLGFRWRPVFSFRDPGVIRMVTLMAPAAIGLAATQVNIFVNTLLASMLVEGSVSWLNYAYRLMQLPIGLFGVAIATVTLAEVSRHAARKDMPELKRTVAFSLRFVFFLTLPATVFLVVLAKPIVALLYQHGRFGPVDTIQTAQALWAYALGLAAFSAVRVLVPVCYSLGMTRLPVTISFITIAANVILNFALMVPLQHRGLALATSIASVLNFTLLFELLRRKIGRLGGSGIARAVGKILLASAVAGAAGYFTAAATAHAMGSEGLLARTMIVGLGFLAGLLTYLAACVVLRIEEAAPAFLAAARVLGARPRPPAG